MNKMWHKKRFLIIVITIAGMWSCDRSNRSESASTVSQEEQIVEQTKKFSALDYGEKWPLRGVNEGEVRCIEGNYIVFVTTSGIYAVNGSANGISDERGWKRIEQIQVRGKDISPFLDAGRSLCENNK